jgi:nucleotide-binding universal stress UspA family protein
VKGVVMTRPHLLIVANDSDFGRRALHVGEEIALEKGWDVAILSTEADGHGPAPEDLPIDQAKLEAAGAHITFIPPSATIHDAGDQAIAVAQETQPDLIVLGIRRRSRVGKLLMGSVAQKILLEVDCPVLVVKATAHA